MRVLSIDFGTSNTVAIISSNTGGRPLLFDGSPLLPSAVYLGQDGNVLVGRDAERNARVDPSRFEPNPKRRIDDGVVLLGDQELPTTRLISLVLARVLGEARRQLGGEPASIRMTHPARWGEHRRTALTQSASSVGMNSPQLIAEPVAAASYFTSVLGTAVPEGRALAIYDLGGGTFDATVVRRTSRGFEVLAEGGLPDVGGLDFDHAIIEHLGATYSGSHSDQWARLMQPTDGTDRRFRRMLWEDVRAAKEMLSRASRADIHLPALEVDAHLTRSELEQLIRPLLQRTVHCLSNTIEAARLTPRDLVGIFLVGGSSRIPLAASLIHSQVGVAPTTLEQPETVVAEGALRVGGTAPVSGGPAMTGGGNSAPAPRSAPPASGPPMVTSPGFPPPGARPNVGPGRLPAPPVNRPPAVVARPPMPVSRPAPAPVAANSSSGPSPGVLIGSVVVLALAVGLILVLIAAFR